jgi:hypothetical protein
MSDENFNSIKELEDAESNQVFSKVDKPIPNVSDFSEYSNSRRSYRWFKL